MHRYTCQVILEKPRFDTNYFNHEKYKTLKSLDFKKVFQVAKNSRLQRQIDLSSQGFFNVHRRRRHRVDTHM